MGIDACIFVRLREGVTAPRMENDLPSGFSLNSDFRELIKGATHEVENPCRFYSPDYSRGPWPILSSALMLLLNSPDVDTVWYIGDTDLEYDALKPPDPWALEKQIEYTTYFITRGNRDYFGTPLSFQDKTMTANRMDLTKLTATTLQPTLPPSD